MTSLIDPGSCGRPVYRQRKTQSRHSQLLQQLFGVRKTRRHQCSKSHQKAESPLCTLTVIVNWLVTMDHSLLEMNSRSFDNSWDIEHLTTSPYNSKGNGKVDAAVKTAKKLLRNTMKLEKTNTWLCYHIGTHIQKGSTAAQCNVS